MIAGSFSALAAPSTATASSIPSIADVVGEDIGPEIRGMQPNEAEVMAAASDVSYRYGSSDVYAVGDKEDYYVGADGPSEFIEFEKRGEGSLVEVWVATNLTFPTGDPRNADPNKITIYDWQVEYIIHEYETVIYPIESNYFGTPDFHDGSNSLFETWDLPFFSDA